jgi:hypothetical protein
MDHAWLWFSKDVLLSSERPPEECVRSLQTLIASPNSSSSDERKRPFRGRVSMAGGIIRYPWPMFSGPLSCRALKFEVLPTASGTELHGRWQLLKPIQIPVALYLSLCTAVWISALVRIGLYHAQNPISALTGPLIGFAMIYGWTWGFVLLSRKAEAQLLSAVFHAMESEDSAKVVCKVLSGVC